MKPLLPFLVMLRCLRTAFCDPTGRHPTAALPGHTGGVPTAGGERTVEYDLFVSEQIVEPAGRKVRALTINGTIPGPTLRFREGDWARIRVHNKLAHEETSLHWHGILLPNAEDGVPHLTTPPIGAGSTHTFEFRLRQAGTYWFHSHTGLQEQQAVYGSIVVTPREGEELPADRDQVLVLSDWTNERPGEVLRTLKRNSNWYGIKKGTAQSLFGAFRQGALEEYFNREKSRMPPMDVSDVAYDAFLINGRRRLNLEGKPGERLRLRLINASAATYFYVESSAAPLEIVSADGMRVEPVGVKRLLIGIAETYDAIVRIPETGRWELRATAQDGSGMAQAFFGEGPPHPAPDIPKPDLYRMDEMLTASLAEMDSELGQPARRGPVRRAKPPEELQRPLSPYPLLRSPAPTALPAGLPRRSVKLHLTGDMQRYIWSFNGKTIDQESVIAVKRGEVLRMELVNDTMMHHPIHLHGHFFRLLNRQGTHAPLKHTVDVPPMGRRTIEFEANEEGDWMFHCHVLYHMMEGMARVVSYRQPGTAGKITGLHMGEHAMPMVYAFSDFSFFSNRTEGNVRLQAGRDNLILDWDFGWDGFGQNLRHESQLLYERYPSVNFGLLGGVRMSNRRNTPNVTTSGVAGGWYRLPYLVTATGMLDTLGAGRLDLAKTFQISPRLTLKTRSRYDTSELWEAAATLTYTLTKSLSLAAGYHSSFGWGAGLGLRF